MAYELDPLRDEAVEFYRRLARAGCRASCTMKMGLVHDGDLDFAPQAMPEVFSGALAAVTAFAKQLG